MNERMKITVRLKPLVRSRGPRTDKVGAYKTKEEGIVHVEKLGYC